VSWPARSGLARHCSACPSDCGPHFSRGPCPPGPCQGHIGYVSLDGLSERTEGWAPGWAVVGGFRDPVSSSCRDGMPYAGLQPAARAADKWHCMALRRCHADLPPASLGPRSVPGPFPRWPGVTQWPTFPTAWPEPERGRQEQQPILRASSHAPGLGHWAGRAGPWVALALGVGLTQAQLRSRFLLLSYY